MIKDHKDHKEHNMFFQYNSHQLGQPTQVHQAHPIGGRQTVIERFNRLGRDREIEVFEAMDLETGEVFVARVRWDHMNHCETFDREYCADMPRRTKHNMEYISYY